MILLCIGTVVAISYYYIITYVHLPRELPVRDLETQ